MAPQQQWKEYHVHPSQERQPPHHTHAVWYPQQSPPAFASHCTRVHHPDCHLQSQQQRSSPACPDHKVVEEAYDIYSLHLPEPTPPDSGRSRPHLQIHAYAVDEPSTNEKASARSPPFRALLDEWSSDEGSSADVTATALVTRLLSSETDGKQQKQRVALAGPSSYREDSTSVPPPDQSPSAWPRSPSRTFAKPDHAGVVFDQRPIRDTPNNPFLEGHRRRYTRKDVQYNEKRHGRGEEAAKAHRKGFLTYVFRGQRILHPDLGSDDDSDDDCSATSMHQGPGTRLQPKLLFPEAHARERRRARMRGTGSLHQAPSTAQLPESQRLGSSLRENANQSLNEGAELPCSESQSVLFSCLDEGRGNLFAAEISRRQAEQTQRHASRKRKKLPGDLDDDEAAYHHEEAQRRSLRRSEFLRGKAGKSSSGQDPSHISTVALEDELGASSAGRSFDIRLDQRLSGSSRARTRLLYESGDFLRAGRNRGLPSYREEVADVEQEGEGEEEEEDSDDYDDAEEEDCPSGDWGDEVQYEASRTAPLRIMDEMESRHSHSRPGILRSLSDNPFDLTVF